MELGAKVRQAYDDLESYSGTTRSVTTATMEGAPFKIESEAKLRFQRPNKIRIEGTLPMLNGQKYTIVSDGTETWTTSIGDSSKWEKAESLEMALASFTGISGGSVATIAATLTKGSWGNRLALLNEGEVTDETLAKRKVYRVATSSAAGELTFWIDAKTYLQVQATHKVDFSKINSERPSKSIMSPYPTPSDYTVTESFEDVKVNGPVEPSLFVRPKGASK